MCSGYQGGNRRNNSSVRLDHLLIYEATASPTPPAQRRRESSSPENALKPRQFAHTQYIISPIFIELSDSGVGLRR